MKTVSRFLTLLAVLAAALMALTATTASAADADGTNSAGACAEATEIVVFELELGDRAETSNREGGRTVGACEVTEILARLSGRAQSEGAQSEGAQSEGAQNKGALDEGAQTRRTQDAVSQDKGTLDESTRTRGTQNNGAQHKDCAQQRIERARLSLASAALQDVCGPCTVALLTKTQLAAMQKISAPGGIAASWLTLEPADPALGKAVANATGDVCDPCVNARLSVPKLVETLLKDPSLLRAQLPGGGSVLTLLALSGGRHDTAKNSIGNIR